MTTNNHTPIPYGSPVDTSVVNGPLAELDSALGNLASLTTTQKANLVAALNELKNLLDTKKLDDLALPDDNTDLNATSDRHGLLPKLNGDPGSVLGGDGTWVPGGSGSSAGHIIEDNGVPVAQRSTMNFTGDAVTVYDDGEEGETIVHITSNPVGGESGQVQFNDEGEMAGNADLTFDDDNRLFSIGVSSGGGKVQLGYGGSAAPSTPGSATALLYVDQAGSLHFLNAAAEDTELGAAGITVSDGDAADYEDIAEIQFPDMALSQPSAGIVQVSGGFNPIMAEFFM